MISHQICSQNNCPLRSISLSCPPVPHTSPSDDGTGTHIFLRGTSSDFHMEIHFLGNTFPFSIDFRTALYISNFSIDSRSPPLQLSSYRHSHMARQVFIWTPRHLLIARITPTRQGMDPAPSYCPSHSAPRWRASVCACRDDNSPVASPNIKVKIQGTDAYSVHVSPV